MNDPIPLESIGAISSLISFFIAIILFFYSRKRRNDMIKSISAIEPIIEPVEMNVLKNRAFDENLREYSGEIIDKRTVYQFEMRLQRLESVLERLETSYRRNADPEVRLQKLELDLEELRDMLFTDPETTSSQTSGSLVKCNT